MCNLFQIIFHAKILSANNICPQNGKSGHLFATLHVCRPRLFDRQMAGGVEASSGGVWPIGRSFNSRELL
jgi:hypothetical protein